MKMDEIKEFEYFLQNKVNGRRIVVIYGNCHTTILSEILSKSICFQKEFVIYPIEPIHLVKSKEYFEHPVFRLCDVFIHQSIRLNNRYGKEFASEYLVQLLKPDCEVIAIPNVYHLPVCFYPQYSPEPVLVGKNGDTIFFRDLIIDDGFAKGFSQKKIKEIYEQEHLFSKEEICEEFNRFIEKVRRREQDWDIKISDFILENYKSNQLFFDPNHPTTVLLKEIAKKLLERLCGTIADDELGQMKVSRLDAFEMPVCPSVREAFDMQYETKEYRRSGSKLRAGKMDLKEYILEYSALLWQNKELAKWVRMKSYLIFWYMRVYNHIVYRFVKRIKG